MTTLPMPPHSSDHVLVASPNSLVRQRVLENLRQRTARLHIYDAAVYSRDYSGPLLLRVCRVVANRHGRALRCNRASENGDECQGSEEGPTHRLKTQAPEP